MLAERPLPLRQRTFVPHWSNLFGILAFACVVVLLLTGVILMVFYDPSSEPTVYHGSYGPLNGTEVSAAYASTLRISVDLPGGLLIRQAHHWAALLLPAAIMLQLLVTFFTGAFRKPHRFRWLLLFGLFVTALLGGWSGYALPDDSLSGTGLRIFEGIMLGIPVIGTWASGLVFGDAFPGRVLESLFPVHVWVTGALLVGLFALWLRSAIKERPLRRRGKPVGEVALLPTAVVRAAGLFALSVGVIMVMAGTMTISPIWLYGPASAGDASAGSQPDWYTGFLDGALRLVPPGWEITWLGSTWTLAVVAPLAVISTFMLVVALYPFLEERFTRDHLDHDLLDRPRDVPVRTGIGVAGMIFYGVLWAAASADIMATTFGLGLNQILTVLQVTLITGPVLGFGVTWSLCRWLQRQDADLAEHGRPTGVIVRLPSGGYVEDHFPPPPAIGSARPTLALGHHPKGA